MKVPPATTSEPLTAIARVPTVPPEGNCCLPRPNCGAKPVGVALIASTAINPGCGPSLRVPLPKLPVPMYTVEPATASEVTAPGVVGFQLGLATAPTTLIAAAGSFGSIGLKRMLA